MKSGIHVYSEIGKLNKVFIHRPGLEIEGLVPGNLERLLFDDIPYLKIAQEEHDAFAKVFKDNDVEVYYLTDQLEKALTNVEARKLFVADFLAESGSFSKAQTEAMTDYLMGLSLPKMVEKALSGVRKTDVKISKISSLADIMEGDNPYYTDPMSNLYFTRDPGACIGNGLSVNSMHTFTRRRESLCMHYIHKYSRDFVPADTPLWCDYDGVSSIEGGDILVLSKDLVAVGCSERTSPLAISIMAEKLLKGSGFEKILVLNIPKRRAFMHLDTVFTMVDYDKFTIHPEIEGPLQVFEIMLDAAGDLKFSSKQAELQEILSEELKEKVELLRCGGGDLEAAQREQWNDGSNTLAIAPAVVVTYERNYVTNELLDKRGIKVISIPSAEISRGRGGPRCMSMPVHRDDI